MEITSARAHCTATFCFPSGGHVDEAIKSEEYRVVVVRLGHDPDWDSQCMTMDETLYADAEKVQNFAVIYLVDITDVPDFNKVNGYLIGGLHMDELYDPCIVMFFYRYVPSNTQQAYYNRYASGYW